MYFQRIGHKYLLPVFPEMETGMKITGSEELKINDVDGYYPRQFLVFLSFFQAFYHLPACVKETPVFHVVVITELNFYIDPGTSLQHCPEVKDTGFEAYCFRIQGLVFQNFDRDKPVFAGSVQDCIEEGKKLFLIPLLAKYLEEEEIVEGVISSPLPC